MDTTDPHQMDLSIGSDVTSRKPEYDLTRINLRDGTNRHRLLGRPQHEKETPDKAKTHWIGDGFYFPESDASTHEKATFILISRLS
ncbi:hypothetical protein [Burkholderia anthina]|uniref:hypothetical protein n=1 Tax=Burkholderia anthina TaxID=179879 RepID=UPI001588CD8C|nr:hypothetical protein [Burkholderia anthina]